MVLIKNECSVGYLYKMEKLGMFFKHLEGTEHDHDQSTHGGNGHIMSREEYVASVKKKLEEEKNPSKNEIYKDTKRTISISDHDLVINNAKGEKRISLSYDASISNVLPLGVDAILRKNGEDPSKFFTLLTNKHPQVVLPDSSRKAIENILKENRDKIDKIRNDPANVERNKIDDLFNRADRIANSRSEDNVSKPMQLRNEADQKLKEWREKYPDSALEEDREKLLRKADKREELAIGARSFSADGWLDEKERERRYNEIKGEADKIR